MSGPDDDRERDREEEGRERAGPSAPGRLDQVRTDREIAAELRLRPERPRVMRLSRRVLATLGGVSAIAVAGALTFALWPHGAKGPTQELYSTARPGGLHRRLHAERPAARLQRTAQTGPAAWSAASGTSASRS